MREQGRYAHQVEIGMHIKTWSGEWKQATDPLPTIDGTGWITFHFTDGTATAMHHVAVVNTRTEEH